MERGDVFLHGSQNGIVDLEKPLAVDEVVIPCIDSVKMAEKLAGVESLFDCGGLPHEENGFFLGDGFELNSLEKVGSIPDDDLGDVTGREVVIEVGGDDLNAFFGKSLSDGGI
jgi:hypothetical protein